MALQIVTKSCPYCNKSFKGWPSQSHCSLICRFWSKVAITTLNQCWKWQSVKSHGGYGRFNIGKGPMKTAHRIAWELVYGEIPKNNSYHGICVLHKCDNKLCCNPNHLFLGTQRDNILDMIKKERRIYPKGEQHPYAKLTDKDVIEIRLALTNRQDRKSLSKRYGVSLSTIDAISTERIWKHL